MDANRAEVSGQLNLYQSLSATQLRRRRQGWLLALLLLSSFLAWLLSRLAPPAPAPSIWQTPLGHRLQPILGTEANHWGIWLKDLDGQLNWSYQARQPFPAASLIKLPLAILMFHKIEKEGWLEGRWLTLHAEDKQSGNGSLRLQPAGKKFSRDQLLRLSLQQSDNTAFHLLCNQFPRSAIEASLRRLGLKQTSFRNDTTSPAEMGYLWQQLLSGHYLSPAHRQKIIDWLKETPFDNYSPAVTSLPVAHKIGQENGLVADSGVIFRPGHRLIFVFLGRNVPPQRGQAIIRALTAAVLNFSREND